MKRLFKACTTGLTVALIGATSFSAQASVVATTSTYSFTGNCIDCAIAAEQESYAVTGSLVLQNYDYGNAFNVGNFVSFSYSGSNLMSPFTWDASEISDAYGIISKTSSFTIYRWSESGLIHFTSASDGSWLTGPLAGC